MPFQNADRYDWKTGELRPALMFHPRSRYIVYLHLHLLLHPHMHLHLHLRLHLQSTCTCAT